jgi:23S rRNA (uracil1939-C5)-methyltransferase
VIDCKTCSINSKPAEVVADAVREFVNLNNISTYDRISGKGLLRHVIVRTAVGTGEVMVILVINGKKIPGYEKLIQMMDDAVYAIEETEYSLESVVLNINTDKTSQVMGEKCITIAGKPTILDVVGNMEFEISPLSFYQVNPVQMENLYNKVLEYAALKGHETVLDLYCGVGTIGLWCAAKANQVLGIESSREAVLDANRNAVINGIVNARYICGKAEHELPKLAGEGLCADVVILDPPRSGCKRELLEAVAKINAARIIYVACDIATQARDIKILRELGYEFIEATPVDMFPWSMSVEAVALLQR